jgi:hypothetical protein
MIGWLNGPNLLLQKRRYWHNSFAPQFRGRLLPKASGTLIEGCFDAPWIARIVVRAWLVGAILLGTPIFILSVIDLFNGQKYMQGNLWVGLVVPPSMILIGLVFPKFGLLLGGREEKFILEFLRTTLIARLLVGESPSQSETLSSP